MLSLRISANRRLSHRPVVERFIDRVERGAAIDGDRFVPLDAQLHADALKQHVAQLEDAGAQVGGRRMGDRLVEEFFRLIHREQRSRARRLSELREGLLFQARFVDQPVMQKGIVIGAIQRLLKSPVLQNRRRRRSLHGLELLERGQHAAVRQQWPSPILLESQQALGKIVGQRVAQEVTGVLPQDLDHRRVGIPRRGRSRRTC